MDISVIIPCYNVEQYVARCIKSILSQTYDRAEYEIVVVLDSCTDGTEAAVATTLGEMHNKKLLHTDCRRPGSARNAGLDVACGEYVWFIDADDYLLDNAAFAKNIKAIRVAETAAVYMTSFGSDIPVTDDFAIWRYFYNRNFIGGDRFCNAPIDEDWEFTRRLRKRKDYTETRISDKLYHYTYPREGSIVTEYMKIYRRMCGKENKI